MTVLKLPPAWSPISIQALLSGFHAAWLGNGNAARRQLDRMLRTTYAPKELYLTDSGTSALTLALHVANVVTDSPVALPAYCCYDIATAADGAGVAFHLYDLNPATLSPDLACLRRAFEAGARSVVVAHLYGVPADLAAVHLLAAEFGALVIEDAAQGSGCVWNGQPAGAHGGLGVLSFGRGKGVTGGRGGALLVNDAALLAAAASAWSAAVGPRAPRGTLKDLVLLSAQWLFGRPSLYWIPAALPFLGLGETSYHLPKPIGGISTQAVGVLNRTLELVSAEVLRRRATGARLEARWGHRQIPAGWQAGWLRFPVVLQRTAPPAISTHNLQLGVMRGYPLALADLKAFGTRRLNPKADFPGARVLAARLVTLPTHRFVRSAKVPVF